ncbi:transposase [Pseudomonas sp. MM213]|uniref:transposase n=1 Tax=Pseudomonas sp. MM213 TaxID=2866807 RepID=UPI001CF36180|nr:transposase [Pseudomonas sp. MM213]
MPQVRRTYSKSFKAQVIAECAQPDISIANVALTHNLNANLVHKWIRVHAQKNLTLQTAFIPVKTSPPCRCIRPFLPRSESKCRIQKA